ncbi:MAG: metalloregulator ArsR/SmtB family transcription factor [Planctomycetota bacterium]
MASVIQRLARSPRQAVRHRTRLDRLLDPALFKALADPTRAKLLSCLLKCGRPCSVTEIAECCSIDFSMVARHLSTMARVGLLSNQKQGRTVWYSADSAALADHFRVLADAIHELSPAGAFCATDSCGCNSGDGDRK